MNPGIALMPLRVDRLAALRATAPPAATDTILPPRTTIEPLSITVPLPTTMWAFVIVRSCAVSGAATCGRDSQSASAINNDVFILPP